MACAGGWNAPFWDGRCEGCAMKKVDDSKRGKALRAAGAVYKVLTGKQVAGRNLTVFDDDVFIVSYPRSGNTWTRFLIGNLLYQNDPITFSNIESRIPEIYFNSDHMMRKLPRPRILKSHECFQPRYKRIIYIVRDPRDVCVSNYHHNVKANNIPETYPMDEFVPRFLRAEFDAQFGSWADNAGSWLAMRENYDGFLLLRYEDMKKDSAVELGKVANFLHRFSFRNIEATPERLAKAITLSTPERMRELEKQEAKDWALTKITRQDKPFVRTATAGGWKNILSKESVRILESELGGLMKRLGYPLSSESAAHPHAAGVTPAF
jgi:hypothetical protein